ncbi:MAG: hypothetical protein KAU28_04365, partial [Phycisphaerae bacterium]|nr:hypothetical protein [Phycisphaerae bacterium]
LITCLIAWLAVGAAADGDRAVTNDDLVAQMRAVWTKTILDTYDATADTDAAWHADARSFIENYITLLSSNHTTSLALPPLEDVERMGRELLAAGCDEPIIHIIYGRVLFGQGMIGEAMPYLRSGYERCRGTPNLQLLTGTTAMRLAQGMTALGQGGDQVEQYYAEAVAAVAQAAGNTMYLEDEQSALLEIIRQYCSSDLPAENCRQLVAQCVAQEHSRRWLCMMLAGLNHLEEALEVGPRQTSTAFRYGPEGQLIQVIENVTRPDIEAERLLTAAWKFRPERPQAAVAMICLATYTGSGSAEAWFDRAMEAQADYAPAHYAYIGHILTSDNWNMDETLRRYGRERLAGDYETFEPSYYFTAMTLAAHNEDEYHSRYGRSPRSYLVGPDAAAGFRKMLSGYDQAELSGELLRYVSLMGAAVSCLSRDWQQAREYLDAVDDLPGHIDRAEWFFRQVDLNASVAIAQAYAETGPAADALAAARTAYKLRNYDDALAILTDAAEVHRDDYWTTAYLHHSIRHTLMKRDLATGEWVDITPDVDLAGWQTARGQAWVD